MYEVWIPIKSKYSHNTKSVKVKTLTEALSLEGTIYKIIDPTKKATAKNRIQIR